MVWTYTPRQLAAYHVFAGKRRTLEALQLLPVMQLAHHGKEKDIQKYIKEVSK